MNRLVFVPALVAAAVVAFAACSAPADKDACTKMADHDWTILDQRTHMSDTEPGKKLLEEGKQKSIDACVGKWSQKQVECHMKAPTPKEMDDCDPKN